MSAWSHGAFVSKHSKKNKQKTKRGTNEGTVREMEAKRRNWTLHRLPLREATVAVLSQGCLVHCWTDTAPLKMNGFVRGRVVSMLILTSFCVSARHVGGSTWAPAPFFFFSTLNLPALWCPPLVTRHGALRARFARYQGSFCHPECDPNLRLQK